jgi:hypothetical protein
MTKCGDLLTLSSQHGSKLENQIFLSFIIVESIYSIDSAPRSLLLLKLGKEFFHPSSGCTQNIQSQLNFRKYDEFSKRCIV